jgi:hypothetical protein
LEEMGNRTGRARYGPWNACEKIAEIWNAIDPLTAWNTPRSELIRDWGLTVGAAWARCYWRLGNECDHIAMASSDIIKDLKAALLKINHQ